jgi:AraC-like DNA-binding protein
MTRLAAAAILAAFPNTTMAIPYLRSPGRVPSPAAGTTVAAIARRWGFSRPDRFAAAYRTAYGRPPRHTLRR